jgi:uncharacterized protein (DUF924 family)
VSGGLDKTARRRFDEAANLDALPDVPTSLIGAPDEKLGLFGILQLPPQHLHRQSSDAFALDGTSQKS